MNMTVRKLPPIVRTMTEAPNKNNAIKAAISFSLSARDSNGGAGKVNHFQKKLAETRRNWGITDAEMKAGHALD